ncbi:hypothetical protein KAT51_00365 [bacterium]|nr:hypothetical protein [bacterium]
METTLRKRIRGIAMYDKKLINKLSKRYAKKRDGIDELLRALEPIIDIQMGKNYSSMKEYWDDMKQDVLLKIWENRKAIRQQILRGDNPDQLFWNRVRNWLGRSQKKYREYDAMNSNVDSYDLIREDVETG